MNIEIREVKREDAYQLLSLMKLTSTETNFLSKEPEEWNFTLADEYSIIENVMKDKNQKWFVAIDNDKIVGQASIYRPRTVARQNHRARMGLCIAKEYWGNGIGGKFIEICTEWAKNNNIEQLELEVVATNTRAKMLYKRYGFKEIYTIPRAMKYKNGTYLDMVGMIKKL